MRVLPVTLLVTASGCAQLFGIDETSGPDVDPSRVSLTMQRWSIGASITKNPLDLSMESASFLVDDGAGGFSKVMAEATANGVFSAPILDGTPPVLFSLPDVPTPFLRLWSTPARDRSGVFATFEHPNPQPPPETSTIMFTATLPSPYVSSERFRIEAIGAWTARNLVAADGLPAPDMGQTTINIPSLAYSSFGRMTNSPAARITSQDVVVVERYVGNTLTGVYQVPPFDQTDAADPITANLVPVPANRPLGATIMPNLYAQRFGAVRPAVVGLAQSWVVNAAPGWSIGSNAGPLLHAGSAAMTDTEITTMFGNPFESLDWRAVFQFATSSSRTYMFMDTVALPLGAAMYTVAFPGTLTVDMPAGLPINIRANLVPLTTDGMTVTIDPTKVVEVDATTDNPTNTLYIVTLYEVALATDGMSVTRTPLVDALATGEAKVRFPGDVFEAGKYYYFDFKSMQGGYTDAATGDLVNVTLPYSVSRADSALFQVMAP